MGQILEFYEGHPERWARGCLARDVNGKRVCYSEPDAVSFCLLGTTFLLHGGGEGEYTVNARLENAMHGKYPRYTTLSQFNDSPDTTFENILAVVREAGV